jgi:ribosomal protein S18 acetylase RimI-like enzyme
MVQATSADKEIIISLLSEAFEDNKSVNYIVRQDEKRKERIKALMDYSFEQCMSFGKIYLSEDKNACALLLFPDQKKTSLYSIFLDIKLFLSAITIFNLAKVLARERRVEAKRMKGNVIYVWYIAVKPQGQSKGHGTRLLGEVFQEAKRLRRGICLETSTRNNLPWYQKHGFTIYGKLDLGYELFFLKREVL